MIIGFQVSQIESKSFAGAEGARQHKSININFDINIRNPSLVEQNTPFGKKHVIKLEYALTINYLNPNIGYIRFEGSTDYYQEGDLEAMHKEWTSGSAPPAVQNEIANTMVSNLAPLALTMSKTLGLPPAVPLPAINFQGKKEEKKPDEPTYY
ncbi:MAG: hypothetical protein M8349_02565, partial [ANME-2 cluster archaeon]|nr:hypothetical protein [ANME-2 cluster archaeon]